MTKKIAIFVIMQLCQSNMNTYKPMHIEHRGMLYSG